MGREPNRADFLETAVRAARAGGEALLRRFTKQFRVEYKGELDLVTDADHEAEAEILKIIQKAFPDHGFLAEESGEQVARGGQEVSHKWVIDPLDGTTNFAHSFPAFCVSIALEADGDIIVGVVFDPVRDELFVAQQGRGASLNGKAAKVSGTLKLDQALLVTGFAYNVRQADQNNLDHFANFTLRAQGIRRTGTAALDLSYLAVGRFDGFWELNLSPWDTAAGILIAEEAGAKVTGFSGQSFNIYLKQILASNGHIHREMIDVLYKAESSES